MDAEILSLQKPKEYVFKMIKCVNLTFLSMKQHGVIINVICDVPIQIFKYMFFFCKGALFRGKGGPPVLE